MDKESRQTVTIQRGGRTLSVSKIDHGPSTIYEWRADGKVGCTCRHELGIFGHLALLIRNDITALRSYRIDPEEPEPPLATRFPDESIRF